jgi:short-subunit dehydrogenase
MTPTWTRALVTGASSGIGAALARQLAAAGSDVVLVARDEARLDALATELATAHDVSAEVLPADLTTETGVAVVAERLVEPSPPIDLLVNNAGFGVNGDFVDVAEAGLVGMIDLNVTALVRLTRAAVPAMVSAGRGTVVNISSMASLQPSPGFAVYGATKAFVTTFSESVHEELRGTAVTVTAVLPGFTRTEFQERAGYDAPGHGIPDFLWQDADAVAAETLAGAAKGKAVVVCGPLNRATAVVTGPFPRGMKRRVVSALARRF